MIDCFDGDGYGTSAVFLLHDLKRAPKGYLESLLRGQLSLTFHAVKILKRSCGRLVLIESPLYDELSWGVAQKVQATLFPWNDSNVEGVALAQFIG